MAALSNSDFKTIIARRDRRYDGRFYFGVKTTSIYCRPVCPARPKPENIVIFKSASEAEKYGYRPCLRCRPDRAPRTRFFERTENTVFRALRLIEKDSEDVLDVVSLASRLGVSDRHLRRLFDETLGASPIEVITTQRLHFTKQLLHETQLPVSEIAKAAGFGSVRRFNEAFKEQYSLPPSELRKNDGGSTQSFFEVKIPIHLPYDWPNVLSFLKRHETYGLEKVTDEQYSRFVELTRGIGTVSVTFDAKQSALKAKFVHVPLIHLRTILARLKSLFDTEHNPVFLPNSDAVMPKGVRVPGCYDPFETAVSIILGQMVSTQLAKSKMKELVLRFGLKLGETDSGPAYRFPKAEVLAKAPLEEIKITRTKATAIRELASAVANGVVNFDHYGELADQKKVLRSIKGIGPWTVAMISMRCFGDPDSFPDTDLIISRALEGKRINEKEWSSSRAYLTHCLWRDFGAELTGLRRKKK